MRTKRRVSLTGMVELFSGCLAFQIVGFIQAKGLSHSYGLESLKK